MEKKKARHLLIGLSGKALSFFLLILVRIDFYLKKMSSKLKVFHGSKILWLIEVSWKVILFYLEPSFLLH